MPLKHLIVLQVWITVLDPYAEKLTSIKISRFSKEPKNCNNGSKPGTYISKTFKHIPTQASQEDTVLNQASKI